MNIFLLSDTSNLNKDLSNAISAELERIGTKVAYISSSKDQSRQWFNQVSEDLRKIHSNLILDYFDLSEDFTDHDLERLVDYSVVYLSGGNSYDFLHNAKARNLKKYLQAILNKGGLIIGVSAGALIISPSINLSTSQNTVNLTDTTGLNFINNEYLPHFPDNELSLEKLKKYSSTSSNKIYCSDDQSGVHIKDSEVTTYGNIKIVEINKII